jgi:hypothetical protein
MEMFQHFSRFTRRVGISGYLTANEVLIPAVEGLEKVETTE